MSEDEQRFVALWREFSPRVMAYALRHLDSDTAQDVVSETFLVAWRRLAAVPDDPLPWLLVVARNTIANLRRSGHRQARLAAELERWRQVAEPAEAADVLATERAAVLAGLAALTPKEREALLLVAWDGLRPEQAAKVAGPIERPAPAGFRLNGGECDPPDMPAQPFGGSMGGSSTPEGIHTMYASAGDAVRAELGLADGSVRPTISAEGMFFFWYEANERVAPPRLTGYDAAGSVVGERPLPDLDKLGR